MPTTKKKTIKKVTPETKAREVRQSAFRVHEKEFAEAVMAPKIFMLLSKGNFSLSYTELTKAYNREFKTLLSSTQLKRYCNLLGWKVERVPTWTGLGEFMNKAKQALNSPVDPNVATTSPSLSIEQVETMRSINTDDDPVPSEDITPVSQAAEEDASLQFGVRLPGQEPLTPTEEELLSR